MPNANNYTQLVSSVITSFDNIYRALAAKFPNSEHQSFKAGVGVVPFYSDAERTILNSNGDFPVSSYPDLIAELTYVNGLTDVADKRGTTINLSSYALSYSSNGVAINFYPSETGIYGAGTLEAPGANSTSIILDASTTTVTFTPAGTSAAPVDPIVVNSITTGYKLYPSNSTILGGVIVNKGKVEVTGITFTQKTGNVPTATQELELGSSYETATLTDSNTTAGSTYFQIVARDTLSGALTGSAAIQTTEGYVEVADVSKTDTDQPIKDLFNSLNAQGQQTLTKYVAITNASIGTLSVTAGSGVISGRSQEVSILSSVDDTLNYYEITATIGGLSAEGAITDGYLSTSSLAAGSNGKKVLPVDSTTPIIVNGYIRKTTVDSGATGQTVASGSGNTFSFGNIQASQTGGYDLTATLNATNSTTVNAGYLASDSTYTYNYTDSITQHFNAASYTVTPSASISNGTLDSAFSTSDTGSGHSLTITATPSAAGSAFSAGYLGSASEINVVSTGTSETQTYYVKSGSVTPTVDVSITATDVSGDGVGTGAYVETAEYDSSATYYYQTNSGSYRRLTISDAEEFASNLSSKGHLYIKVTSTTDATNIFMNSAPASGDFYQVQITPSATVSPGYIDNGATGSVVNRYLPKAVVRYVEESEGVGSFIQVTKGGYLPAGYISEITDIGTLSADIASVKASLSGSILSSSTTAPAGSYEISIAVNSSETNVGYFSSDATLSLDQAYYIAPGDVTLTRNVTLDNGSSVIYDSTNETYKVSFSISDASAITATSGYIDKLTVEGSANSSADSNPFTIDIGKAEISSTVNSVAIINKSGTAVTSPTSTSYYLVPDIATTDKAITNTVSTAGYVGTGDTHLITNISGNDDRIYIQEGSLGTISADSSTTLGISKTADSNGNLVLGLAQGQDSVKIVATAGTEGYSSFAANNNLASVTPTLDPSTTTVAAVSASIAEKSGSTLGITADSGLRLSSATENVLTITATYDGGAEVQVATPGYLANGTIIPQATIQKETTVNIDLATEQSNKSITAGVGHDFDNAPVAGNWNQSVTFNTAYTYSTTNYTATMDSDAMGYNVANQLYTLSQRLKGESVSASVSS